MRFNQTFAGGNSLHALPYYISALSADAMKEYRQKPEGAVPSVTTLAPAVMVVNLRCSSTPDTEAYNSVQDRVFSRPFHGILGLTKEEIVVDTVMTAAEKASLLKLGHHGIVRPLVDLQDAQRGRRQLSAAEASITEALRLWTYARLPAIAMQIQGTSRSALITDQTYDWLSEQAPNVVRLAGKSVAGKDIPQMEPGPEATSWVTCPPERPSV
ncbi:hypothetical protein ACIPCF_11125 [Paracoccus marcusii]|uniref:hypothetical protein n=1 Tax=Paracoccus marcusii TaxID=59779 RepID=UPI0038B9504E